MSMKKFKRAFATWAYGLIGGMLGGGASSLASKFGLDGLHAVGVDVPQLNFKQMGYIFLFGIVSHAVLYVMKSPLPPLEFDDTQQFTKPPEPETPKPKEL
jgi:hypothetical protein